MKIAMIGATDAGFFSNFRGTVSTFKHCESLGLHPYVNWDRGLFLDPKRGNNVWEYYFEQITQDDGSPRITLQHDLSWNRKHFTRELMNRLINDYVKILSHIEEKVEAHKKNVGDDKYIGVHLRLTDKHKCTNHGEPESGKPVEIDKYIYHAQKYLEKYPGNNIFLATDSTEGLEKFEKEFGSKLYYRKDVMRSDNDKSVHFHNRTDNYKKGEDVLIDCLLLSQSSFLLKGISSVALCALFFNTELKHMNLNDYYNGDRRESFIMQDLSYV